MKKWYLLLGVLLSTTFFALTALSDFFDLLPLPKPFEYGNILITRQTGDITMPTVSFSHWTHRTRYTCRVCHFELDFEMETNATEITEEANRAGKYCGTCHNGEIAFGHSDEYCVYCHNFGMDGSKERYETTRKLPRAPYGNNIDWVEALEQGLIEPKQSILDADFEPIEFTSKLDIEADWGLIPGAEFSHDKHMQWLDCGNCHPDIFSIKKKGTKTFDMQYNLKGKFCGACHLKVAFPMDECNRCHLNMSNQTNY